MNYSTQKRFFATLTKYNLTDERGDLIEQFTEGRTRSSKQLTDGEARQIIYKLTEGEKKPLPKRNEKADKQRKKIIAELCKAKIKTKEEEYYFLNVGGKPNMPLIYKFILEKGYLKKGLNDYTENELPKLVTQIGKIRKHYD